MFELILNTQVETVSPNPPVNHSEEGKRLLAVTSSEATNSVVFNITDENNSFSFSTPRHWSSRGSEETFTRLQQI